MTHGSSAAPLGIETKGQVIWVPMSVPAKDYALFRLEAVAGRVGFEWLPKKTNPGCRWQYSWG